MNKPNIKSEEFVRGFEKLQEAVIRSSDIRYNYTRNLIVIASAFLAISVPLKENHHGSHIHCWSNADWCFVLIVLTTGIGILLGVIFLSSEIIRSSDWVKSQEEELLSWYDTGVRKYSTQRKEDEPFYISCEKGCRIFFLMSLIGVMLYVSIM